LARELTVHAAHPHLAEQIDQKRENEKQNADEERVRFAPHMKIENDKKKVTLFLQQGGKALKHAYTKDEPNGLPQMKQIKVKGVMQWDDTEMMEFLENMVNTTILPKLKKADPVAVEGEETDEAPF
jgi:hypothetical protein